ncbi:MAG TPA: hypothetical protein VID77_13490 [Stellaceae bacterium]|jgi:hypothetical protein
MTTAGLITMARDRRIVAAIDILGIWLSPVLLGLSGAFLLRPDANWDLANYHYYNAWAFLNGRIGEDIFPAGGQTFLNPILDLPFYWANVHLPGRMVAFGLAFFQGTCISGLYLLSRRLLFSRATVLDAAATLAVAFVGITGAVSLSEVGTVFHDYVGAVAAIFCFLLLVPAGTDAEPLGRPSWRIALAGFILGSAGGLKETNLYLAAGITVALPLLGGKIRGLAASIAVFVAAELAGMALCGGFWAWFLWRHFHNPVYPFFNAIFQSPFAPAENLYDVRWSPHGWAEWLFYPWIFFRHPHRVAELALRDLRIPVLFVAAPLGALLLALTKTPDASERRQRRRFLRFYLGSLGLAYMLWLIMFPIQRYAMALEVMAAPVCAMIAAELPWRRLCAPVTVLILAGFLTTFSVVSWGRGHWRGLDGGRIVDVTLPDLGQTSGDLVLLRSHPAAFVAPWFPAATRFIQFGANDAPDIPLAKFNLKLECPIAEARGRIFIVVDGHTLPTLLTKAPTLQTYGLGVSVSECRTMKSTVHLYGPLALCPVHRVAAPQAKC